MNMCAAISWSKRLIARLDVSLGSCAGWEFDQATVSIKTHGEVTNQDVCSKKRLVAIFAVETADFQRQAIAPVVTVLPQRTT